jgi:hypothetical protein
VNTSLQLNSCITIYYRLTIKLDNFI